MKTYRTKKGPFNERPYYEITDIEKICTDELRAVNLYPETPSPIRIDRFIEKKFGIVPKYDELVEGVLGFTTFGQNGVQDIFVARFLDEEGTVTADRRIRTTLAHEAGHGLLHAHLFVLGTQTQPLFGDLSDPNLPKVLCRHISGAQPSKTNAYDGQWWEHQANLAIGALLLPRHLVEIALKDFLVERGSFGLVTLDQERKEEAIKSLSEVFDVNAIVARIRVNEIYPEKDSLQLSL